MMVAALLVFSFISMLSTFINELDELGDGNYSLAGALIYTALDLPSTLYSMLPYGVIIGLLVGLGRLASRSELVALASGGMSRLRISATVLVGVLLFVGVVVAIAEVVGSRADFLANSIVARAKQRGLSAGGDTGMWLQDGNVVVNAGMVVSPADAPPELWNVRLYQFDDKASLQRLITAPKALATPTGWKLSEVEVREVGETFTINKQAEYLWRSNINAEIIAARSLRPRQQSIAELATSIRYARANKLDARPLESAVWYRISHPLNVIALALVALPFAFASTRSGGFARQLFLGMLLAIGFFFVHRSLANTFEFMDLSLAFGYLITPVLLSLIGLYVLRRSAVR